MLTPYTEWRLSAERLAILTRYARLWSTGQCLNFRCWLDVPRLRWA